MDTTRATLESQLIPDNPNYQAYTPRWYDCNDTIDIKYKWTSLFRMLTHLRGDSDSTSPNPHHFYNYKLAQNEKGDEALV
jgi:hypothetical protein